jgi:hypothetical protein
VHLLDAEAGVKPSFRSKRRVVGWLWFFFTFDSTKIHAGTRSKRKSNIDLRNFNFKEKT